MQDRLEQAREKRQVAALIRKYAAGLSCADRRDLVAHAAAIDAEADRIERSLASDPPG